MSSSSVSKTRAAERRPMHLRLSPEERRQLDRVAVRLGLSPSSAIRYLVNAEDRRGAPEPCRRPSISGEFGRELTDQRFGGRRGGERRMEFLSRQESASMSMTWQC